MTRLKAASPLTCGIERLFMTLPDYSFTLSINFYEWLFCSTLSQFIIAITRVSQNISQDDSCNNHRDDVSRFAQDSAGPVTGHWCDDGGWCLAWSPLGTQLHLMTTSPRSWPWDCQDLSHQQSIQCQARACAVHCSALWVVTYNDGTGPGLGLVRARQSPEY